MGNLKRRRCSVGIFELTKIFKALQHYVESTDAINYFHKRLLPRWLVGF